MNKFLTMTALLAISFNSFSAEILSGKLDASKKNIVLEVKTSGGCGEHKFDLEVGGCLESYPVQCSAKLLHTSTDFCEAIIIETAVLPLAKYGFKDSYYRGGKLTIIGSESSRTGKPSTAVIKLP